MTLHVSFPDLFAQAQFNKELLSTCNLNGSITVIPYSSKYCEILVSQGIPTYIAINTIKSIGYFTKLWSKQKSKGHIKSIYY